MPNFCIRVKQSVLLITAAVFAMSFVIPFAMSCSRTKQEDFLIGVSQCSDDVWRQQLNNEIRRESNFYPGVHVEIRSADDDNEKQIEDIRYFIRKKVDLLVVAPNESGAVTEIIESAYSGGIPVILVDRSIDSEKYTAFIGADNRDIGRQVGEYLASRISDGDAVELTGTEKSSPAAERSAGFREGISGSGIRLVASEDTEWSAASASGIMDSLLTAYPSVKAVFAHNDRIALAARRAAEERGRDDIFIIGIDAMFGENQGVDMVYKGLLDASFVYPTGGDSLLRLAMKILKHEPFEKNTTLATVLVDSSNARVMLLQGRKIKELDDKMAILQAKADEYFTMTQLQKMFLTACFVIVILLSVLLAIMVTTLRHNKLTAAKLAEVNRKLEEATNAKLSFFTNVSHDFRTPLTLVADPVNQLIRSQDLNDRERFLVNIAHKNVTILLRLVNQILDFRKYESGKLSLVLSRFRLDKALADWMAAFDSLARVKHIDFTLDIAENHAESSTSGSGVLTDNAENTTSGSDSLTANAGNQELDAGISPANASTDAEILSPESEEYTVTADMEKVERIVYNLLSNAFKFTDGNGGGYVHVRLLRRDDGHVEISVSDNGEGISAEHINNIFNSFYQADVHHSGSGIGLMLSKAFAELHGGSVSVSSTAGKGSVFTVVLPVSQKGGAGVSAEPYSSEISHFRDGAVYDASQESLSSGLFIDEDMSESKKTVLVIDDNQDVRSYLKSMLSFDYNVLEASNGQEGLKTARKFVPDAVICDVMMPVMDGMECCRILKSDIRTSHIPVLMLTAYAVEEQKIKGYECGADSYISKPFSSELLLARIGNLINSRQMLASVFGEPAASASSFQDVDKGFIDRLKDIISSRLSDPELTVESIGEEIGLSRVQLYRKTKSLIGYSPNEFLRICRLRKASAMLSSTEKTVSEIAYSVGFSSPSYFTKCFKEYFGENPVSSKKNHS